MRNDRKRKRTARGLAAGGFTLVEILIVVVVLGILAAIAVPKLSNASQSARENTLKDDLRFLRTQITVYQSQHHEVYPGYPGGDTAGTPTEAAFIAQLTLNTDEYGNTNAGATATYKFGPYLTKMPENPVNGLATLKIIDAGQPMTADATTGWLYQPSTGAVLPNLSGIDSEGKSFSQY
jgi:general secretion pathway protein G